ncbi:MAG: hypothetical protein IPJ81_14020 [Chitinophagaceae bacterium]|nr:hypothetical protein [Chitinophagaceae bacterium]
MAVTDVFNSNTNFNLSTFANPRPIFYSYVKSTNEIWGIRNVTVNSKKKLLTKFSLADKTYTDVDIFPFSNSSRQIIKVDETNKYIYFLEGTSGYKGFNKVMRCNFNGGDMKVMYEDNKNDIASAMMGIGNKIYYHSVTYAALMELDLVTKKSKVMVINFYPTSGLKFTGFKEIVKNNIAYWQPQYTTKYISARALNSYDIDFSTNTVFWLQNPTGLIKKLLVKMRRQNIIN